MTHRLGPSPSFLRLAARGHMARCPGMTEEVGMMLARLDAAQAETSAMIRMEIDDIDRSCEDRRRREADASRYPTNPIAWLARNLFG